MIEVGEYVRTDDGRTIKIDGSWKYSTNNKGTILFINITQIPVSYYTKNITKHSKNLIDLIEIGDYVNGYQVRGKTNNKVVVNYYMYSEQLADGFWLTFYEDEIKDIVTHEQFEAMKYKVEV